MTLVLAAPDSIGLPEEVAGLFASPVSLDKTSVVDGAPESAAQVDWLRTRVSKALVFLAVTLAAVEVAGGDDGGGDDDECASGTGSTVTVAGVAGRLNSLAGSEPASPSDC